MFWDNVKDIHDSHFFNKQLREETVVQVGGLKVVKRRTIYIGRRFKNS